MISLLVILAVPAPGPMGLFCFPGESAADGPTRRPALRMPPLFFNDPERLSRNCASYGGALTAA
eukprot:5564244-Pyramimonas_sp.AAC.1